MADILRVPPSRFVSPGKLRNLPSKNMYFLRKPSTAAASFAPTDISGLKLWLDANEGVSETAGDVDSWADQSGFGHNFVQATGANQPTYDATGLNGKPTITFDRTQSHFMDTAMTTDLEFADGAITFFAVINTDNPIAAGALFGNRAGGALGAADGFVAMEYNVSDNYENIILEDAAGNYRHRNSAVATDIVVSDRAHVYSITLDNTDNIIYHDDFLKYQTWNTSSGTVGNVAPTDNLTLGDRPSLARYYDGKVSEILLYSGVLSDADKTSIYEYLEDKWLYPLPSTAQTLISDCDARFLDIIITDASVLYDQSGNTNGMVQGTSADRPFYTHSSSLINYHPAISTDGITDHMETKTGAGFAGGDLTGAKVIFHVTRVLSHSNGEKMYDGLTSGKSCYSGTTATEYTLSAGTELTGGTPENTAYHIHCDIFNGANSKKYVDGGAAVISGDAGSNDLDGITWGTQYDQTNPGHIASARFIVYDGLLTDTEINSVGNMLADMYALTWTDI